MSSKTVMVTDGHIKRQSLVCLATVLAAAACCAGPLDELVPKLDNADLNARQQARTQYERICRDATRPGAGRERAAVAKAIGGRLARKPSEDVAVFLIRQLELVGGEESVATLERLLHAGTPLLRERARCALQVNASEAAARALRAALGKANAPAWRVALINALGARKDPKAVSLIAKFAGDGNDDIAAAAAAALAAIGDAASIDTMLAAFRAAKPGHTRLAVGRSALLLAENLRRADMRTPALRIYRSLSNAGGVLQEAAIVGLGCTDDSDSRDLRIISEALKGPDARMRTAALAALSDMPVENVYGMSRVPGMSTQTEVMELLIRMLTERADATDLSILHGLASGPSRDLRLAACAGLARLGDATAVEPLINALACSETTDYPRLRSYLASLRGDNVDAAIAEQLAKGTSAVRVELIRCLADRQAKGVESRLLAAMGDSAPAVRAAALRALGSVGNSSAVQPLTKQILQNGLAKEREAAGQALAGVLGRAEPRGDACKPVVDALGRAGVEAQCTLLGVLAGTGEDRALSAIRSAVNDTDEPVRDAAVRALASWPDSRVAEQLLEIALETGNMKHHVLAMRGFVRLAGRQEDVLRAYRTAMGAARRDTEKREIIAAIAGVHDPAALGALTPCLEVVALRQEAAMGMIGVAKAVGGTHPSEARKALDTVLQQVPDGARHEQAKHALAQLGQLADYVTSWQVTEPYSVVGKTGPALHDEAFPPEKPGTDGVSWQPISVGGINPPLAYVVDLENAFHKENCVAYLRTAIWSPARQAARLEFSSDDGAKVWLNGDLVVNAPRPSSFGKRIDKVAVTLEQGWNPVLVKVWNGGSHWSAAARFRASGGSVLEGIRSDARRYDQASP